MNKKLIISLISQLTLISLILSLINADKVKGAEWVEVKKRGYLIVGVKNNLPPLASENKAGKLEGFEIDIAHRLAEELFGTNTAIKFLPVINQDRLQVVIDDQVDLTIAHVTANSSRYRVVDFSSFYYLDGTGILIKKNHQSKLFNHNSSEKIAVLEGSSAIAVLKYNLPNIKLVGVKSYQEGLNLINQGQVTGLAGDVTNLAGLSQNNPNYQLSNSIYGGYPLAIVMPKGLQYQELRNKINTIIKNLEQQGWLKERAKYWGLPVFDKLQLFFLSNNPNCMNKPRYIS